MMISGFELTDIDWTNKDVSKIVEFANKKFNEHREEVAQKDDTIAQLQARIKQLEGKAPQTKPHNDDYKKPRSYNTRKYKDYPH